MLKKYWYLSLVVVLFINGCGGSSSSSTTPTQPAVVSTPTVCVGAGVGPRNHLVIVDCPTETSGVEQVLEQAVRVSNNASQTVTIETNQGRFDVAPGDNFEAPNTGKAVNWYLK